MDPTYAAAHGSASCTRSVYLLHLKRICKFESPGFNGLREKAARARRISQQLAQGTLFTREAVNKFTQRFNCVVVILKLTIPRRQPSCLVALMVLQLARDFGRVNQPDLTKLFKMIPRDVE